MNPTRMAEKQMMLLYLSSGFIEYLSRFLDGGVDFSGNIALETADDVTLYSFPQRFDVACMPGSWGHDTV